ncbi:helix-turn-helix transcriptional regulator [Lichenihabitans sp. Uapishka_5]|uniref:helix-turn-helix domain-containing protein n=1 Tax=Lichenihabitans sp. Uapishka_5 TaxID=3037302 RepID=UPI0029E80645|nr:helix-turn-helix transcriptional regulator [Lichenihabitans sp. Uapishka_5]MDX7951447.1 helix-turn-helix transcriptional regulator [Lichenihabitans sp. Uapishka_5]
MPMSMNRDQLRAARILLHLRQEQLASEANMGVATLRRYEGGHEISALRLKALREAIERAGAVLISGEVGDIVAATGIGVALLPRDQLPEVTRKRLEDDAKKPLKCGTEEGASEEEPRGELGSSGGLVRRKRGRPRKSPVPPAELDVASPDDAAGAED